MALTWDQISSVTEKKYLPKLVDNIFDSNVLLQRFRENGQNKTVDGGTSVLLPLEYAMNAGVAWYTGAETLSTADSEVNTAAEYSWKNVHVPITIIRTDELKNMGDAGKLDIVKIKTKNAEKTLADTLGTGIYSNGTNAKSVIGLQYMMSNSHTIGGISSSTYSWWRPGSLDTTTTTLTLTAMQTQYNAVTIGNDGPSVIISTRANFNRFWALLQPSQRFQDSKSADAGWSSLMFNGTPFLCDSHAPTAHILFLNEKYLSLTAHSQENFRFAPYVTPENQNAKVAHIYWTGIFGTSNLRMQTALTGITA
jgi:hypothetical protein